MAIEKIELSEALQNLATQTNIDKLTGVYNGVPANIAKADLASVVAGVMNTNKTFPTMYRGVISDATDFDTIKESGYYKLLGATGDNNGDIAYGTLTVSINDGYGYQMITNVGTTKTTVKMRNYSDSGWAPWSVVDNFGYNSLSELATGVIGQVGMNRIVKSLAPDEEVNLPSYMGLLVLSSNSGGYSAAFLIAAYGVTKIGESSPNFSSHFSVTVSDMVCTIKNLASTNRNVELMCIATQG